MLILDEPLPLSETSYNYVNNLNAPVSCFQNGLSIVRFIIIKQRESGKQEQWQDTLYDVQILQKNWKLNTIAFMVMKIFLKQYGEC